MKPMIGVSGSVTIDDSDTFLDYRRSYTNEDYVDSVIQNGGIPCITPFNKSEEVIKEQPLNVQGLVLSGRYDVDPYSYKEEPEQKSGDIWPERDQLDMLLLKLVEENGVPILRIRRGVQIIDVYYGGALYQDLSYRKGETLRHNQRQTPTLFTHTVETVTGTKTAELLGKEKLQTNSFHHQLTKDVASELKVSARCVDGIVEAIEDGDASVIAVQQHPEMLHRVVSYRNNLFKHITGSARREQREANNG